MKPQPARIPHPILLLLALVLLIAVQQEVQSGTEKALQQLKATEQVYRQQGPEAALPGFEQLRLAFQQSDDTGSEGTAIRFIGEIHWRLGDFEKADQFLQTALTMKRENGDRLQEGKTLNVLGLLSWDLGDYDAAKDYFRQGTAIAQDLGDNKLAGAILNNLSLVHDELGDYLVSLEQYQKNWGKKLGSE